MCHNTTNNFNSVLHKTLSAKEMQVCLTKIFLVKHQILHNMRQNRETLFQISKRNIVNPRILVILCIFNNVDPAYQKSNIKSNRSDISDEESEKERGIWGKGRTLQFILLRFITRRELPFIFDPITIRKRRVYFIICL